MSKFRAVCFTLNNYTEEEVLEIKTNVATFKYCVFQEERGENGTKHLQGYAVSCQGRTLSAWKTTLGRRCHIEQARGNAEQNRAYCTKDSDRIAGTLIFECGILPRQGKRNDIAGAVEMLKSGRKWGDVIEEHPEACVKYFRGLQSVKLQLQKPRTWKTEVFWFYGPTGTGKSREAYQLYPEAYYKMGTCRWWDGYDSHEVVVIDDYRRDLCTFGDLLRLFDRYPLLVETKGGTVNFVAKTIVVTTSKSPRETWENHSDRIGEEDIRQLLRRIENVRFFPEIFARNSNNEGGGVADTNESVTGEHDNVDTSGRNVCIGNSRFLVDDS